jgi:hypothetical protein
MRFGGRDRSGYRAASGWQAGWHTCAAMCMQCAVTAATAVAGAAGLRSWAAAHRPRWLTPLRMRRLTAALLTVAVVIAGIRV